MIPDPDSTRLQKTYTSIMSVIRGSAGFRNTVYIRRYGANCFNLILLASTTIKPLLTHYASNDSQ